jgi:hypothetical protein
VNEEDSRPVIRVAMVNPWDIEAIDLVQRISWHRVEPVLASKSGMLDALEKAYQLAEESNLVTDSRIDDSDKKIILQQMLESSIQQAKDSLAELESIRKYLGSV